MIRKVKPKKEVEAKEIFTTEDGIKLKRNLDTAMLEPIKNVSRGAFCLCGHEKKIHYGGEKGHCNTFGCGCLEHRDR